MQAPKRVTQWHTSRVDFCTQSPNYLWALDITWVTQLSDLNSKNPWIFQLVTPSIEAATRATRLAAVYSLNLFAPDYHWDWTGVNLRFVVVSVRQCAICTACLHSAVAGTAKLRKTQKISENVGKTQGNFFPWTFSESFYPFMAWRVILHVSCTELTRSFLKLSRLIHTPTKILIQHNCSKKISPTQSLWVASISKQLLLWNTLSKRKSTTKKFQHNKKISDSFLSSQLRIIFPDTSY